MDEQSNSVPIVLSTVKPDFQSIVLQAQLYLQQKSTWIDMQASGIGQALVELMAAGVTLNQFGIESAAREGFLSTAFRDSSIYAIANMLGVRVHRKLPAGVKVELSRTNTEVSQIIPKYVQFNVDGKMYFNRFSLMFSIGSEKASERVYYGRILPYLDLTKFKLNLDQQTLSTLKGGDRFKFVINAGGGKGQEFNCELIKSTDTYFDIIDEDKTLKDVTPDSLGSLIRESIELFEGTIVTEEFVSTGLTFSQIVLSEKNFRVSDVDVEVTVINQDTQTAKVWDVIPEGLWNAQPTDSVYYEYTSGFGESVIKFGDNYTGVIPPLGSTIQIRYAVTSGVNANNGLQGLTVNCMPFPEYTGVTLSTISGGADPKPASYYRNMAPFIFKARNRAVTPDDYLAISLDYPGIISAKIQAQRDIAPGDVRWMNVVSVCLLPLDTSLSTVSDVEKDDFQAYLKKRAHTVVDIILKDPDQEIANIDLTVAMKKNYTPSSVIPAVEAAIKKLFSRQTDTLGRRIPVSDVVAAAMVEGVDYVTINSCKLYTMSNQETVPTSVSHDLIPSSDTTFISLNDLIVNTKYSERLIYQGETQ